MTRTIALAGTALDLHPGLRERLLRGADSADPADTTVLPGLAHGEDAVAALPAGTMVRVLLTDQFSLLNAAYCDRLLDLHHALSFEAWVEEHLDDAEFAPATMLAPVLARPDLDLEVVVLDGDVLDPGLPGPTLVSATRVLHKRLRATGAFQRVGRATLADDVARLQAAAREQAWDDTVHWGWTPELLQQTSGRVSANDEAFASATGASPWPPVPPQRATATTHLSDAEPRVVYGVMTAVQAVVTDHAAPEDESHEPAVTPTPLRTRVLRRLRRVLSR